MKLTGRILWLSENPENIQAQLEGNTPNTTHTDNLHYGVNTDAMISGAACTLGYTGDILGPYFLENFKNTVTKGAVQRGDFQVIVGGEAYGSGSSREVAVVAHQGAGIALVVAHSFQRIFQENMVYCGLPFTTDFSILQRLADGEDVSLDALATSLPPFFRTVQEHGGLLHYGSALLNKEITPHYTTARDPRAMTCVEKIIAAQVWPGAEDTNENVQPTESAESVLGQSDLGIAAVSPGEQVLCRAGFRGVHEYTGGMVMALYAEEWGKAPIDRPELAAAFEDHFVLLDADTVPLRVKAQRLEPARNLRNEMVEACTEHNIRLHSPDSDLKTGVCHRIVLEDYGTPGSIIILTDSHTPTAGVLNAFAFGVGSTAMAFALRTGLIPVTVPKTVRIWVEGEAPGMLSPKDLILHLIGDPYFKEEQWRTSPTDTCVMQFGGPGLNSWNVDELSVLTNMTVEGGMMTGIVEPCQPVRAFLQSRRPRVNIDDSFVHADDGADYTRTITLNLSDIPLTVATPGDSRNRLALSECGDVAIHNVVIASCTGGSYADLKAAADILRGQKLHAQIRLTVIPSSSEVEEHAERDGLLELFRSLGAVVAAPGCGSCIGNGPGIPYEGEATASTTNRNFERRMGAKGPVYLVSPAVAAATAIRGKLTDPRDLSAEG